mmetsp:Transcript_5888/g.12807  ORF Transcript_5888/g.12807 Transcript_5888/m.12807 type:complete len:199 (-) Transcript_5888:335-931(-)
MDIEIVNAYGKTRTDEFLKMNPCHICPTLEIDSNTAIWESGAIMRYLCNIAPNGAGDKLYPNDPLKRARVDLVLDWRQTSLYPCFPAIGYGIFGVPVNTDEAKEKFNALQDEHFNTLMDVFLKDTKFVYSDTPTIADLAVAPCLTFIKARRKFWDAVPDKVKEYHKNVLEAFPATKENFNALDGMCTGWDGEGCDAEP